MVYSKSYEDHIDHLDKVLTAIEKSNLTLSPTKCHLFYGSILLLGHKVSRLGLSTHEEKVKAVIEMSRPKKVSELQSFIGMVVYFSTFIPFFSDICQPLFSLLRKGARWMWSTAQEESWIALKLSLQEAPVLGHPMEGKPYRLYTDASDLAIGCALQQVQPIRVGDLKGTKAYDNYLKAYNRGDSPPKTPVKLSQKTQDDKETQGWAETFDESIVQVERVIAYWSRTFKSAETRYSATEREALAAKEGLVRFQPFIEGEKVTLVTDHAALQWARTYENSNRRLAAWGAVFSAYAPNLEIVHRPGRKHSNVDPLSRITRAAPKYVSPKEDTSKSIIIEQEEIKDTCSAPAQKVSFTAWGFFDDQRGGRTGDETRTTCPIQTRQGTKQKTNSTLSEFIPTSDDEDPDKRTEQESRQRTNIYVRLGEDTLKRWVSGYQTSPTMKAIYNDPRTQVDAEWTPGYRYSKDENGLLYFLDADYHPRLCVPESFRSQLLMQAHEVASETAHCSAEKLWQKLTPKFYWRRMKADLTIFCRSCDICQKTKTSTFNKWGYLMPNSIPENPYSSVSMDFIVNLPMSNGHNAIFVVVDRLSKHASFIPTTMGLTAEDFGRLFVKKIATKFGIPKSIICDRDPRWTSEFWKAVAKALKSSMLLSSSHHPQTDGQTEIVNKFLETMIRAYIKPDKTDWADWIHLLEFAYNSAVHSSTGTSPFSLLLGYNPRSTIDFLPLPTESKSTTRGSESFLQELSMHREDARLAIAKAQHEQSIQYNRRRKEANIKEGDRALVNPHSLEWLESKKDGAKLNPRWVGPFEVVEKVNNNVYHLRLPDSYPGSPVINISHLRKYIEPPPGETRTQLVDGGFRKEESPEYEVERILGHKRVGAKKALRYLVRWVGYRPQFDLWLSEFDLRNSPQILRDYKRREHI